MGFLDCVTQNNIFLAPMAGVTDATFRAICKEMGCGLTCTEMVSAKGLHYNNENTKDLLLTGPAERPYAVQLFGKEPEIMARQAELLARAGAGVIDINMGCPAHKITANGEGSALMKTPALAAALVRAVSRAVDIPVTVKFRKGWDGHSENALEFALAMQESGAAGVTVHGRTREQQYGGRSDWEIIARIKEALNIPVIGNGDIKKPEDALALLKLTRCDGVMVARGAMGNPWIFHQINALKKGAEPIYPSGRERVEMALRHARGLVAQRGKHGVPQMRKHVAWYLSGLRGGAGVRARVNHAQTLEELTAVLRAYARQLPG